MIYCAKYLNVYLEQNWSSFSRQPYFDASGLFISVVLSAPLLVINMVIVVSSYFLKVPGSILTQHTFSLTPHLPPTQVNHLIVLSGLVVQVKRAQLKHKAREAAREAKKDR